MSLNGFLGQFHRSRKHYRRASGDGDFTRGRNANIEFSIQLIESYSMENKGKPGTDRNTTKGGFRQKTAGRRPRGHITT
jgi:hypothetical protein